MGVSVPPGRPRHIRRIDSFRVACRGLVVLLKTQPNARIHAVATVLVVTAGWWFRIDRTDWICVTLAAGSVWAAEGLNTAIEFLTDRVSPEWSSEAAREGRRRRGGAAECSCGIHRRLPRLRAACAAVAVNSAVTAPQPRMDIHHCSTGPFGTGISVSVSTPVRFPSTGPSARILSMKSRSSVAVAAV